jgi:uncharacterized protein YqhQ
MKSSGIGGQAVIEGVMMRNRGQYAIAVRKPNGEIEVDVKSCADVSKRKKFFRLPIVRGIMAFIDSLTLGMSTLQYSASFYDEDADKNDVEKKIRDMKGSRSSKVMDILTVALSVVLALFIFVLVPMLISSYLSNFLHFEHSRLVVSVIEGVLRVAIFILYIVIISKMEDIKRMFMYHGAEHKCINCIEHGRSLTVENVRRSSKEHKRCGTSFMLNVMLISILLFMVIDVETVWFKLLLRLILIPVIAGLSYEFTRVAGNTDNRLINLLSKPGLLMQALTTKEPDDAMIEVGIASVEAVFDWEPFVEELKNERRALRNGNNKKKEEEETTRSESRRSREERRNAANNGSRSVEATSESVTVSDNDKNSDASRNRSKNRGKNQKNRRNESYRRERERLREEAILEEAAEEEKVTPPISEDAFKSLEVDISELFGINLPETDEESEKITFRDAKMDEREEEIKKRDYIDKERDDLLAALDVMFEYTGAKTVTEMSDDPAVTGNENVVYNFDSEAVTEAQQKLEKEYGGKQRSFRQKESKQ